MSNSKELFPLVNADGNIVGSATRGKCHSGSKLLHPVVHLHLVTHDGRIYLQKRSDDKDIQPGKWDTAVGGHVDYGESIEDALRRETREELGLDITGMPVRFIRRYIFESEIERELVNVYALTVDAETIRLYPDPSEISEGRFWRREELTANNADGMLTPNFVSEYSAICEDLI